MLCAGGSRREIPEMRIDLAFARGYSLAVAEGLDPRATCWEFPSGRQVDPTSVRPVEQAVTWSLTGGPEVTAPVVVSHGAAYRVWVDDPEHWEEIAPGGVHEPIIASEPGIVAFADHTVLIGYGSGGLVWESEPLVWDDLRPVHLDGATLQLEGFDAPRNEIVSFTVDLRSGRSLDAPHPGRWLRSAD